MPQQFHVTLICQFKATTAAVDTLSLQQEELVRISSSASAAAGFLSLILPIPVESSAVVLAIHQSVRVTFCLALK